MLSKAGTVGSPVPDFTLMDENNNPVGFHEELNNGPVMLIFYPEDFTLVCTKQQPGNYRNKYGLFKSYGINVFGISSNTVMKHKIFSESYAFPFRLLSDPRKLVARAFGATSLLMFGGISRAIYIVGKNKFLLYRYVEPTVLTHRNSADLAHILRNLRDRALL